MPNSDTKPEMKQESKERQTKKTWDAASWDEAAIVKQGMPLIVDKPWWYKHLPGQGQAYLISNRKENLVLASGMLNLILVPLFTCFLKLRGTNSQLC
jgi:hypothetical protein